MKLRTLFGDPYTLFSYKQQITKLCSKESMVVCKIKILSIVNSNNNICCTCGDACDQKGL